KKQQDGQREKGTETGLAALFRRAVDQFGIEQAAVGVRSEGVFEKRALGGKQLERPACLGIDQVPLDEGGRVGAPAGEGLRGKRFRHCRPPWGRRRRRLLAGAPRYRRGADRRASTRRRPSAASASQAATQRAPWPRQPARAGQG